MVIHSKSSKMPYKHTRVCPVCEKPNVVNLSSHLQMVHGLNASQRTPYLDASAMGTTEITKACVPISQNSKQMSLQHPFTMVISGPTGSGKTEWTRKLFLSDLITPAPDRIIWCFGQWQPLYDEL